MDRAAIATDDLVKLALLLVVAWLALEVLGELLDLLLAPFAALRPLVGLVVLALVAWYLLDRL
jgi:Ca2+/H+ antiporter